MSSLQKIQYYVENGENHEKSNLSDYVFKDIDYTLINYPISFFRSDFCRTSFQGCTFFKNEFGRADFIDSHCINSEFSCVNFGSCLMKNFFFEKTHFSKNNYRGVAIQYSYFKKCVFRDEDFITNMYQCEFHECTFINCTFKKSSLDCNSFKNCEFVKVDMSECVAENIKFDSCALRDVFLCANLWTSYLYKNTDIYNFGFKYHGEIIEIWNGDFQTFLNDLLNKKQYFEYINTLIIGENILSDNIFDEFKKVFPLILTQHSLIRKRTLIKILDMIIYYHNYDKLPLDDYLKIYDFLITFDWSSLPFEEELVYRSKLYEINKYFEKFDFGVKYLYSISPDSICISKIHLNFNKSTEAINYLETIFNLVNTEYCEKRYKKPLFTVLSEEKGSVILTIASASLLVLLVSYVAKKTMHNVFSIQVEQQIKNQIISKASDPETDLTELKKICAVAKKYHFLAEQEDSKQIKNLSDDFTKGEIIDIILNFLF